MEELWVAILCSFIFPLWSHQPTNQFHFPHCRSISDPKMNMRDCSKTQQALICRSCSSLALGGCAHRTGPVSCQHGLVGPSHLSLMSPRLIPCLVLAVEMGSSSFTLRHWVFLELFLHRRCMGRAGASQAKVCRSLLAQPCPLWRCP